MFLRKLKMYLIGNKYKIGSYLLLNTFLAFLNADNIKNVKSVSIVYKIFVHDVYHHHGKTHISEGKLIGEF